MGPSDSVKSFLSVKKASTSPDGPRYGRPSGRFGPPTALFSGPLAWLKRQLDHPELISPPSASTLDAAFRFVSQSCDFFLSEKAREITLKPILEELLPGITKWQESTASGSARVDAAWIQGAFTYLIVELKNESGLGGDPFLQGLVSYEKIVAQNTVCPVSFPHPICPLNHTT